MFVQQKTIYSREEFLGALERSGFTIKTFSLHSIGNYTKEDAIWNYRDAISHLSHLHPQVNNIPLLVQERQLISVFIQKLFFFKVPLTVVDQLTDPYTQSTFTHCFFFSLFVENRCQELAGDRCEVITTYDLGMPRLLGWTFPLLKWVLTKNYHKLMLTDIPCRERRGELRHWGYRFESDHHGYLEARNIHLNNALPPSFTDSKTQGQWPENIRDGEAILIGRSDHRGIKLIRRGDWVYLYPRMCPHEGASLDAEKPCQNLALKCPWHGRTVPATEIVPYKNYQERLSLAQAPTT